MPDHQCTIRQLLIDNGLHRSKDRQTIIACFFEPRAWSLAQLVAELPETTKSTIFRNIQILLNKKIITQVVVSNKQTHYGLADRKHHAHAVCPKCGVAKCIPCPVKTKTKHNFESFETCLNCK
ncbi:MAG: transcriptional repressor [Patescibacteria group bacterium]